MGIEHMLTEILPHNGKMKHLGQAMTFHDQHCKYSNIPMAMNQELSFDTGHEIRTKAMQLLSNEERGEITLDRFGCVRKRH